MIRWIPFEYGEALITAAIVVGVYVGAVLITLIAWGDHD